MATADSRATAWVLVADHTRARLFAVDGKGAALSEVESLLNPAFRLHEGELVSDRAGRLTHPVRRGGTAVRGAVSARQHQAESFAKSVCACLKAKRVAGRLARLHLVAEPDFLGLLRDKLDASTRKRVATELNKSLTRQTPERIRAALPRRL